ncbi:hypothetical protein [Pseudobacteriovorax antillogorgiicola]|uniref:hypothetical protein n=1 Tax=Pseudobacteriovorax antillogorgiicola TaxID=1513793 RepID=UPI00104370DF|nr:hypothetical protein [Pseudobacteriovorax antillogorgiicola]
MLSLTIKGENSPNHAVWFDDFEQKTLSLSAQLADGIYDIEYSFIDLLSEDSVRAGHFKYKVQRNAPTLLANVSLLDEIVRLNPQEEIVFSSSEGKDLEYFYCSADENFGLDECNFRGFSGALQAPKRGQHNFFIKGVDKHGNETGLVRLSIEIFDQRTLDEIEVLSARALSASEAHDTAATIRILEELTQRLGGLEGNEIATIYEKLSNTIFKVGQNLHILGEYRSSQLNLDGIIKGKLVFHENGKLKSIDTKKPDEVVIIGDDTNSFYSFVDEEGILANSASDGVCRYQLDQKQNECILLNANCKQKLYDANVYEIACINNDSDRIYISSFVSKVEASMAIPGDYKSPTPVLFDGVSDEVYISYYSPSKERLVAIFDLKNQVVENLPFPAVGVGALNSSSSIAVLKGKDEFSDSVTYVFDRNSKKVLRKIGLKNPQFPQKSTFYNGMIGVLEENGISYFYNDTGIVSYKPQNGYKMAFWDFDPGRRKFVSGHYLGGSIVWYGEEPTTFIESGGGRLAKAMFGPLRANPVFFSQSKDSIVEIKETDFLTIQSQPTEFKFSKALGRTESLLGRGIKFVLLASEKNSLFSISLSGDVVEEFSFGQKKDLIVDGCMLENGQVVTQHQDGSISRVNLTSKESELIWASSLKGRKKSKLPLMECNEKHVSYEFDGKLWVLNLKSKKIIENHALSKGGYLFRDFTDGIAFINEKEELVLKYYKKEGVVKMPRFRTTSRAFQPFYVNKSDKTIAYIADMNFVKLYDLQEEELVASQELETDYVLGVWSRNRKMSAVNLNGFLLNEGVSDNSAIGKLGLIKIFVHDDFLGFLTRSDLTLYSSMGNQYVKIGYIPNELFVDCTEVCQVVDGKYMVFAHEIGKRSKVLPRDLGSKSEVLVFPLDLEAALSTIQRTYSLPNIGDIQKKGQ